MENALLGDVTSFMASTLPEKEIYHKMFFLEIFSSSYLVLRKPFKIGKGRRGEK